ncbi:interleukin-12 receptor subunit beta-2 [Thalassophryne amazonica]|uniref:interleukin-12 receptor subunit beta-2 n=1 Tax=Thalassophryne amazonica TaxID=390379 RepID=UPI0014717140|nr:interleukin-12 receptor subunit beta-2 [Thalassophryne amazonica]
MLQNAREQKKITKFGRRITTRRESSCDDVRYTRKLSLAKMSQTWTILTALTVLTVHLCLGEKSCVIWSSAGSVVRRGSSFDVCCIFNCNCKASMYKDHPDTPQSHTELNSTMICLHVVNITKNRTYSCKCNCQAPDPCGLDVSTGYPPDPPENITCIYSVSNLPTGTVTCTWKTGRNTYLSSTSTLRVTSQYVNHTQESRDYGVSNKGSYVSSATFSISSFVQLISVRVRTQNHLDYADSDSVSYTLSDIAMPSPPVLVGASCSSRVCRITVEQSVGTPHLEIQYRARHQPWTTSPESQVLVGLVPVRNISSLEPYRLYHFRARAKFSTGLWSGWSLNISNWTDEEAPAKELDVWYAEISSQLNSVKVYWKVMNSSVMRGEITKYTITVFNQDKRSVFNISATASSYIVPSCAGCEMTVHAHNSKGTSPPAKITTPHTNAKPPLDVRVKTAKLNVTISWRKPETAPGPHGYVVEWYPQGHKLEELRWVRLDRKHTRTVVTDMKPFECYHGAVSVLYDENSVSRTTFTGVSILESAPQCGPSAQQRIDGKKVEVIWAELPRDERGGCITNYTIYIENKSSDEQFYNVPASKRSHVITGLSPALYSLWMTACTAEGESPAGQIIKFFIQQESRLPLLLMCAVLCLSLLCVLCVCQSSAVKQRFWMLFQCCMLSGVPDPANSKWAKECSRVEGKRALQIQPSNSSVTEEEEDESMFVDVEELLEQSADVATSTSDSSSQPTPQSSLIPETLPLLYPLTSYIKSFSHDSDYSDHTETSQDTNTTVDYISSQGPENRMVDEEDQEEEEDGVMVMLSFFPSHNLLMEPLSFGGKLSLETVKIDCSNLFQNT